MQNNKSRINLRKVILCAVFAAFAYVVMMLIKIPVVAFLKYEPKDVIIALAGFIAGPVSAVAISLITCFVEMIAGSDTGPIGFLMNFLSSACFSGLAAAIYMKKRTVNGAVVGLVVGTIATTVLMLLWNYIVTPWYMNVPREAVAAMLVPTFLPFNLLKYSLNSGLAMLLYKPVSKAVKRAGFGSVFKSLGSDVDSQNKSRVKISVGVAIASIVVIASCIMLMLVLGGRI